MIITGKNSMSAVLDGKVKLNKDDVDGKRLHLLDIIIGHSEDNGDYGYFILEDDKYVSIPSSSFEIFAGYLADANDIKAIRDGGYDVIIESHESKKGRKYFVAYLEVHTN